MMNRVLGSAIVGSFLLAHGALAGPSFVQALLVPPAGAPDADAEGKVRLDTRGDKQVFRVLAEDLGGASFEVWLENGAWTGVFFSSGSMTLVSPGAEKWELLLEADGMAPPALGVTDIAQLGGRRVQVRDAGGATVFLEGAIPGVPVGGVSHGPTEHAQVFLQRPETAPDPDALGMVELERCGGRQGFHVDLRYLPTDVGALFVAVETGFGSGYDSAVGALSLFNVSQGRFELTLMAEASAPASLDVADLADLAGRHVRIVDGLGTVYLWGMLPALAQSPGLGNFNRKADLTRPPAPTVALDVSGFVRWRYNAAQGAATFEVRARNLPSGMTCAVWIEDATGLLVRIGTLSKGCMKRQTRKGQSLPLGVGTLIELVGRRIEIRDDAAGPAVDAVLLEGQVP